MFSLLQCNSYLNMRFHVLTPEKKSVARRKERRGKEEIENELVPKPY